MVTRKLGLLGVVVVISSLAVTASAQPRCPTGQRPGLSGCVDGSSQARVRTRPTEAKPAGAKPVPKPDPALAAERATPKRLEIQKKQLLIRELARLETMLEKTPENSPDHPVILRRLAEGYAELELIAERERANAQAAADDFERAARDAEKTKKPKQRGTGTIL